MRAKIASGEWPRGGLLPSRRELARQHDVEVNTIQKAIGGLLNEGLLRAETGRGTFVADGAPLSETAISTLSTSGRQLEATELSSQVLGLIASITPEPEEIDSGFYWPRFIISALENSFLQSGQGTIFCNIDKGYGKPFLSLRSAFLELIGKGATVVAIIDIFAHYEADEIAELFASDLTRDIPTVLVASRMLHGPIPFVSSNLSYGAFLAAEHLLQQGARELFFVTPIEAGWVDERIAFAREAVSFRKLPRETLQIFRSAHLLTSRDPIKTSATAEAALHLAREMAANGTLRGGIIAANDVTGHQILKAADEAGLAAGKDFLVVGVDDAPASVTLGLTSIRPPLEALGREANLLLKRVIRHQSTGVQVILRPQLIVRSSSRRIGGDELLPSPNKSERNL